MLPTSSIADNSHKQLVLFEVYEQDKEGGGRKREQNYLFVKTF